MGCPGAAAINRISRSFSGHATDPDNRSLSIPNQVHEVIKMSANVLEARGGCIIPTAERRGYHIVYREHETNHCPGCGHTHWYIGRMMAECAFCTTALPLESAPLVAGGATVRTIRGPVYGDPERAFAA
jgi:hypothetical protein